MVAVRTARSPVLDQRFRLGAIVVDPQRNQLLRDDQALPVEPRVMQLLVYLAGRPGEIVSKGELMDAVWQANVVDEAIQRAVSLLRSALGDSAQQPRVIATVPRRGYRLLIAPVPERSPKTALFAIGLTALAVALGIVLLAFRMETPKAPPPPVAMTKVPGLADTPPPIARKQVADTIRPVSHQPRLRAQGTTPSPGAIAPPAPTPLATPPHEAAAAPEAPAAAPSPPGRPNG